MVPTPTSTHGEFSEAATIIPKFPNKAVMDTCHMSEAPAVRLKPWPMYVET